MNGHVVIGMGMPASATYLESVSILGPALVMIGTTHLAAHMFIFYFAVFSAITPPICVAAFAAAIIAQASWLRIALIAVRLAAVCYVIPFIIVYEPALILIGRPLGIAIAVVSAGLGSMLLGSSAAGFLIRKLNLATRIFLFLAGVLLLVPGWQTDLIAIAVVALVLLDQRLGRRLITEKAA
ncbi:TRAP transporter large permease subunit [Chloroflexota bacterium]